MTRTRPAPYWVSVHNVLIRAKHDWDEEVIAAIQAGIDQHLLSANSRDDPGSLCVTSDGVAMAMRSKRE